MCRILKTNTPIQKHIMASKAASFMNKSQTEACPFNMYIRKWPLKLLHTSIYSFIQQLLIRCLPWASSVLSARLTVIWKPDMVSVVPRLTLGRSGFHLACCPSTLSCSQDWREGGWCCDIATDSSEDSQSASIVFPESCLPVECPGNQTLICKLESGSCLLLFASPFLKTSV